jgi:hypothetical protein
MFIQTKNWNQVTFEFHDDYFLYILKDSNQTQSLKVPYLSIDITRLDNLTEKNDWFRNVGIIWLLIWGYEYFTVWKIGIWLILWIGLLVTYIIRTTNFSILHSDEWKIFIIQDDHEREILDKIRWEKRKILRERLFVLDENNSPENELEKYVYLKNEKAITEDEFKEISERLLWKHGIKKS